MKKTIFYARRTDGLGERLRALLNAIALSKVYNSEYKFTWQSNLAGSEFHTTETAERVFAPSYLAQHCVDPTKIDKIQNVAIFLEDKNPGNYFCDQTIPVRDTSFARNTSELKLYQNELKNSFWEINFSSSFKNAIQEAQKVDLSESTVALHLRAGDLIYDRFKHTISYLGKAIPFPIAEKIIENAKAMGQEVLIFGQDRILENYLRKKWDIDLASDLLPKNIEKAEASIFDVVLMSRCKKIYAGNSGFSVLSSIIGSGEYIHYFDFLKSHERFNLIKNYFEKNEINKEIPGQQIAYACKAAIIDGYAELSDGSFNDLAFIGKKSDEKAVFFDFVIAWKYYFKENFEMGDSIILELMEKDKSNFIGFIKNNTGSPHQRKIFRKFFNPEIIKNRDKSTASGQLALMINKFLQ